MTPTRPTPVVSFSEADWRRFLVSERLRPNLLIVCASQEIQTVVTRVLGSCRRPVHACPLPGELSLTDDMTGTLLLWDVAQLTRGQQMKLQDWITDRPREAQVISITSAPLLPLVEDGQFLEGLFYRINVVSLVASVSDDRPDPQANARSQMEQKQMGIARFRTWSLGNQYPGRWPFLFQ
jgi:transcriptional regulator of aromatic amino acid metabolism